jgi:hypothetical protein
MSVLQQDITQIENKKIHLLLRDALASRLVAKWPPIDIHLLPQAPLSTSMFQEIPGVHQRPTQLSASTSFLLPSSLMKVATTRTTKTMMTRKMTRMMKRMMKKKKGKTMKTTTNFINVLAAVVVAAPPVSNAPSPT